MLGLSGDTQYGPGTQSARQIVNEAPAIGPEFKALRAAVRTVEAGQRGCKGLEGARLRERVSRMAQWVR